VGVVSQGIKVEGNMKQVSYIALKISWTRNLKDQCVET